MKKPKDQNRTLLDALTRLEWGDAIAGGGSACSRFQCHLKNDGLVLSSHTGKYIIDSFMSKKRPLQQSQEGDISYHWDDQTLPKDPNCGAGIYIFPGPSLRHEGQ